VNVFGRILISKLGGRCEPRDRLLAGRFEAALRLLETLDGSAELGGSLRHLFLKPVILSGQFEM
jgi:hypothetical protein